MRISVSRANCLLVNSKITKTVCLILFLLSAQYCNAQDLRADTGAIFLDIKFGEFFKKDKIGFSINDVTLFREVILENKNTYGLTNVWVTITHKKGGYFVFTSESKTPKIMVLQPDKVTLSLIFRGKKKRFQLKLENGKYVVFETDRDDEVVCNQTIRRPFFD